MATVTNFIPAVTGAFKKGVLISTAVYIGQENLQQNVNNLRYCCQEAERALVSLTRKAGPEGAAEIDAKYASLQFGPGA